MTTARKRRDAMLAAAGLGPGDLPPDIRFSLAFLTGPQASTVRAIETAVTIIGREEGDVIINDPEASRRHAQIEIHPDGTAWLTDLGSTNGTSTLGATIEGPTQLTDRQEFTCGRSTFMLLIRPIDTLSPD
jgi:pSer/pThr/pTyr-binding forkhead associated (FHA) protein